MIQTFVIVCIATVRKLALFNIISAILQFDLYAYSEKQHHPLTHIFYIELKNVLKNVEWINVQECEYLICRTKC